MKAFKSSMILLCILFGSFGFAIAPKALADEPQVIDVWPGTPPNDPQPVGEEKVYCVTKMFRRKKTCRS